MKALRTAVEKVCTFQNQQLATKTDEKMPISQIRSRFLVSPMKGSRPTRRLLLHAYKSSAPSGVRLIQPSSDMHETEAAIKTLGQVRGVLAVDWLIPGVTTNLRQRGEWQSLKWLGGGVLCLTVGQGAST